MAAMILFVLVMLAPVALVFAALQWMAGGKRR